MGMTSLSIILTVFVLQLHHGSPGRRPPPAWLRRLMIGCVTSPEFKTKFQWEALSFLLLPEFLYNKV